MRFQTRNEYSKNVDLNLVPLIDVLFNILIFFAVSTTFTTSSGINVRLPQATSREIVAQKSEIRLVMTAEGKVFMDGKEIDDAALSREFRAAAERDLDTSVIVQADQSVSHGKVVHVMDLARRNKLTRLAIATQAEVGKD